MKNLFTSGLLAFLILFSVNAQETAGFSNSKFGQQFLKKKGTTVKETVTSNPFPASSPSSNITLYGCRTYDDADISINNVVSFSSTSPASVSSLNSYSNQEDMISAGEYYQGNYYLTIYSFNEQTQSITANLTKLSATNWTTVSTTPVSRLIIEMTYDYSTNKTYVVYADIDILIDEGVDAVFFLGTLDLSTGTVTQIAELNRYLFTLAANLSGTLYAVDDNGNFCTVNKTTAAITTVGSTGVSLDYLQSMAFDHNSNTLYWAMCNTSEEGKLLEINVSTGSVTDLGTIGENSQIVGLHTPYSGSSSVVNTKFADIIISSDLSTGSVKISSLPENSTVNISDLSGKRVKTYNDASNDLSFNLVGGIYFIEITNKGNSYVQKLIVK